MGPLHGPRGLVIHGHGLEPCGRSSLLRPFFGKFVANLSEVTDRRDAYIKAWIKQHRETLDPSAPRDFVDHMLLEQNKIGLTDDDVMVILWDMMAGGIDTTANSFETLANVSICAWISALC